MTGDAVAVDVRLVASDQVTGAYCHGLVTVARHLTGRGEHIAASLTRQFALAAAAGGGVVDLRAATPDDLACAVLQLIAPDPALAYRLSALARRWDVPETVVRLALLRLGDTVNEAFAQVTGIDREADDE